MLIKIHNAYRLVVAVCDKELIGKKFQQEINGKPMQLDLTGGFFKGEQLEEKEIITKLKDAKREDATFNFVGDKSCNLALKLNLIKPEAISKIQNIPCALVLV